MAEFMKKILDLFQDLDTQVTSIHQNVTEIINVANFACTRDEAIQLMNECAKINVKLERV